VSADKRLEWLKTFSMVAGTTATVAKAVLDYRKFRRDQEKLEYTRNLQRRAWEMVMKGELSEARIDDITLKAPPKKKTDTDAPDDKPDKVEVSVPEATKPNGKATDVDLGSPESAPSNGSENPHNGSGPQDDTSRDA